jgi:hypothetical protein
MWKKTIAWTIGTASATGVVVFGVLGLIQHWGSGQFGPLAAWVSGAGTLAAVTVALWQGHKTTERALEEAKRADDRLAEERTRHRDQLRAQRAAVLRQEQIEAGKEIASAMHRIWRLTSNFGNSFRFEQKDDVARDTYLTEVAIWSDEVSDTTHKIELARLGLIDEGLHDHVETGLKRVRSMHKELAEAGVPELIKWDAFDHRYEEVKESVRTITTYLNVVLNPAYVRYVRKQLGDGQP